MIYVIDLKLPSLNDYIRICRGNKFAAAKYKKELEEKIGLFILKMPKFTKPIKINFTWIEGTKRRDYDNICFAKKFILDSMVKYNKLPDDNRKYVYAFTDSFKYGNETKVILEIEEKEDESNNNI